MAFLKSATCYGQPIQVDGITVTPISRSLRIQSKRIPFGLHWERPVGVQIQDEAGKDVMLPIVDVTRRAQIAVFLLAAASWIFARRRMRSRMG